MTVELFPAAERPELVEVAEETGSSVWPPYLATAGYRAYWSDLYKPALARHQTIAVEDGEVVALANSVPFWWEPGTDLPDEGWGWVLEHGVKAAREGTPVNALSALSVAIHPSHRGTGLASRMLEAMKPPARAVGLEVMVAPVRPTLKASYPLQDFATYCAWQREDRTPFDPWLRTHVSLGAKILAPAMRSMTVTGTIEQWQKWTGLRFPESGEYAVAGALAPLKVDLATDRGVYVEPNFWMQHPL